MNTDKITNGQRAANSTHPNTANGTQPDGANELSPKHRTELETESAISAEAISARGYFSINADANGRETLKELGFSTKQVTLGAALVIPIHDATGEVVSHAIKPDIPRNDSKGKAIKYELPQGSAPHLDVSVLTRAEIGNPLVPLLITEGAKKADSAATKGFVSISLNGVYGFSGKNLKGGITALADWESIALKGKHLKTGAPVSRLALVAFDSDAATNPRVENALRRLCGLLQSRGATVKVVHLTEGPDGEKTGLDDYFARGGTAEGLHQFARDLIGEADTKRLKRADQVKEQRAQIEAEAKNAGALIIETNDRQQEEKLADLSRAIQKMNAKKPTLFFGFDGLVKIARDAKDAPRLKRASRATIQTFAGRAAHWIRTSEREGVFNVAPPRELCEVYLDDQESWRGIPAIQGTASAPFFAPDGTLCASSGYHAAARLWLELPHHFDLGDTAPTPENIAAARRMLLHEILGEVAFADAASRAHALAQMLLPFVRNLINGATPLHLWNAPAQSSGKTYGAEICILPFTEPMATPEKASPEEWRKSLLAELQTGPSHIFLDNLKGNLNSSALDMAITSGFFRDRMTGTGEMVTAPARCVWVATANNAELSLDAATRSILIQLDANCENPEAREFCGDPAQFIKGNRGRVCGAIITLVRAWQAAGAPAYSGPNRCRFPEWARTIGGILQSAEIAGFLDNIAEQRASISGEAITEWHEFTELWFEKHGENYVGTREILPLALQVENIAAQLEKAQSDSAKMRDLGKMLQKRRDRVFGEWKIKTGPTIQKRASFRLQRPDLGQNSPKMDVTDGTDATLPLSRETPQVLHSTKTVWTDGKNALSRPKGREAPVPSVTSIPNLYGQD